MGAASATASSCAATIARYAVTSAVLVSIRSSTRSATASAIFLHDIVAHGRAFRIGSWYVRATVLHGSGRAATE